MKKSQKILPDILKGCTPFQLKVLQYVASIPFGQVRTYRQIARAVGSPRAYRAVGSALRKNPLPFIIPCHRVIKSNGDIGNYAYGKKMKEKLLNFELCFKKGKY